MIFHLASRQNPRVKNLVKLRLRRQRDAQDALLIDGAREISRAVEAGLELVEAYCCLDLCKSAEAHATWNALAASPLTLYSVTPEVYQKIRFGERCDGLIAVARRPVRRLDDVRLGPEPFVAVIEGLEKPGNVGAIVRSADGAGLDAVIVAGGSTDLYHPHVIRNSMGTVFASNVVAAPSDQTLAWLVEKKIALAAARPDAEREYTEYDFCQGTALLLGSEATGLSSAWRRTRAVDLRLPMQGIADSLNVAAAAAILFYEARRQRRTEHA